jgi:hypothetical protein
VWGDHLVDHQLARVQGIVRVEGFGSSLVVVWCGFVLCSVLKGLRSLLVEATPSLWCLRGLFPWVSGGWCPSLSPGFVGGVWLLRVV